jgi:hypothetical protein
MNNGEQEIRKSVATWAEATSRTFGYARKRVNHRAA